MRRHPGGLPAARAPRSRTSCKRRISGWDNDFWDLHDWYREA